MRQAARISRMKSSAVADIGRRLSGPATSQGSAANPDQVQRDGLAATDIPLSDTLRLTLRLGAAACGVDEAEFVRRAIAEKAGAVGLCDLADARTGAAPLRSAMAGDGDTKFTDDGDLIDVPPFVRCHARRFSALTPEAPGGAAAFAADGRSALRALPEIASGP